MKTKTETAGARRGKRAVLGSASADPVLAALGARIRSVRERADVAQEVLAAEIPMSRSHFGKIERGETNVTVGTLLRIAVTLKTPVEELVPPLDELARLMRKR